MRAVVPELIGGPGYELTPLSMHSEYIKRLIVKLERPVGRDLYLRWYETLQNSKLNPEVYEPAPDTKLGTFPGYQNVRLMHYEPQRIIANDEPSWKDALSSVKGVYVIADLSSGRLYVGSASGEASGLWSSAAASAPSCAATTTPHARNSPTSSPPSYGSPFTPELPQRCWG